MDRLLEVDWHPLLWDRNLKSPREKTAGLAGFTAHDLFRCQSWDEFSRINFDLVITVCDNAAGEACPVYLSSAPKLHWGVEDPAKFQGSEKEIENEFQRIFSILAKRTHAMIEIYKEEKSINPQSLEKIKSLI